MRKILDNKLLKFIFRAVETAFFIILICYVGFVIAQRLGNNNSVFGYRVYTVATGSMNPKYVINDVIVVKDAEIEALKVGDDIAYIGERGGMEGVLVSHRIIKISLDADGKLRFVTQGINNDASDPSFTEDRVVGKVEGKLPIINELNHLIKNQFGFFFLIFCPLVLAIFLEVAETIRTINSEEKTEETKKIDEKNSEDDIIEDEIVEDSAKDNDESETKEDDEDNEEIV